MIKKIFANFEWGILASILTLLIFGLAIIRSVAPTYFSSQLIYGLVGLILFILLSQIDYRVYPKLSKIFYCLSLLGLILTFIFGAITRGSIRWLEIAGFTFQPSELVKPLLIITFAAFFSKFTIDSLKSFLSSLFLLLPPAILIFIQPDLGNTIIIIFVWLGILVTSDISAKLLLRLTLMTAIFLPFSWFLLKTYQQVRILSFLNPFSDPLGSGYSIIQAMVAVGSGRFLGRGLGWGTQSHLKFLPEHHTDFIFASFGEELGFVGSIFLILVFVFLFWRLLRLAGKVKDKFSFSLAIGTFTLIFSQFFINIGMNLGLMPITGITLPLISSGGSSLVAIMICLGIVENIFRVGKESHPII